MVMMQVTGATVLGVGLWTLIWRSDYVVLLPSAWYSYVAYMLVGAGALVLVVGVLGCCGVLRESRCSLLLVPSSPPSALPLLLSSGPLPVHVPSPRRVPGGGGGRRDGLHLLGARRQRTPVSLILSKTMPYSALCRTTLNTTLIERYGVDQAISEAAEKLHLEVPSAPLSLTPV